jgi:hypothetical protein
MTDTKFHGWTISVDGGEKLEIGVTQMPDRKRPCLYILKDANLIPLAYFQTIKNAIYFMDVLDLIIKLSGGLTKDAK